MTGSECSFLHIWWHHDTSWYIMLHYATLCSLMLFCKYTCCCGMTRLAKWTACCLQFRCGYLVLGTWCRQDRHWSTCGQASPWCAEFLPFLSKVNRQGDMTCDMWQVPGSTIVPPLFHLVLIRFTPRSAPDILGPHAKQGCPSNSSEAQGPAQSACSACSACSAFSFRILNLKFEPENPDFKKLESWIFAASLFHRISLLASESKSTLPKT